jgi:hypothetical protein
VSLGTPHRRCWTVGSGEPFARSRTLDSDEGGDMMPVSWEGMSVWWIAPEVRLRHGGKR